MWSQEQRELYLSQLQRDVQKVRSDLSEITGNDVDESLSLVKLEKWIFGEFNIVLPLSRAIELGSTHIDCLNFATIAQQSPLLRAMGLESNRTDPSLIDLFGKG